MVLADKWAAPMLLELEALVVLEAEPVVPVVVLSVLAALTAAMAEMVAALDKERQRESSENRAVTYILAAVEQFAATTTLHLLAVLAVVVLVADPAVLEQLTRVAAVVVLLIPHQEQAVPVS